MLFVDHIPSACLDHREMQLIQTSSVAIMVLAGALVLFMYRVAFSATALPNRPPVNAFFGFCFRSVLLAGYLLDRYQTIQRLRSQIAHDRIRSSNALKQANTDFLQALPTFDSFQDRLLMKYRRAVGKPVPLA